MKIGQEKVIIRLPKELKERLDKAAEQRGRTRSGLIRLAVNQWFRRVDKDRKERARLVDEVQRLRADVDEGRKEREKLADEVRLLRADADFLLKSQEKADGVHSYAGKQSKR